MDSHTYAHRAHTHTHIHTERLTGSLRTTAPSDCLHQTHAILQDYYSEEYDFFEECFFDASGKPVLANNTATCDIKIMGVDKRADKLKGGLDGVYQLKACYNGKALYMRRASPAGEDRVLWYSSTFGDWDVSKGTEPNEAEVGVIPGIVCIVWVCVSPGAVWPLSLVPTLSTAMCATALSQMRPRWVCFLGWCVMLGVVCAGWACL